MKWVKLGEIADIKRGIRVVKEQLTETGQYAVYQNSLAPMGYHTDANMEGNHPYVICAGSSSGAIGFSKEAFWAADDCYVPIWKIPMNGSYLFHAMINQQFILKAKVRSGAMPRLSKQAIENLLIPLPSLSEQHRIASILDRFEALTTSISEGLPAEIEARRKQYEYYRDKLLTFERKAS